jgi:predicted P-loop ATPase
MNLPERSVNPARVNPVNVMNRLPIRIVDDEDKRMVAVHNKLVATVKVMIAAAEEYSTVRTPQEQTAIERRILATDRAIDNLVYDLYGLDDSERKIVDAAFALGANSIEYMAHAAK